MVMNVLVTTLEFFASISARWTQQFSNSLWTIWRPRFFNLGRIRLCDLAWKRLIKKWVSSYTWNHTTQNFACRYNGEEILFVHLISFDLLAASLDTTSIRGTWWRTCLASVDRVLSYLSNFEIYPCDRSICSSGMRGILVLILIFPAASLAITLIRVRWRKTCKAPCVGFLVIQCPSYHTPPYCWSLQQQCSKYSRMLFIARVQCIGLG